MLFRSDGATYTVTDGQSTYDFTASVGRPVSLRVVTTEVTVGKETPIEYEILDANGIDVKTAYPGDITYTERITNGYRTKDNKIYMTRVGDTGTVTLTYKCASDPNLVLTGSGTFVCKAASVSNNTNLTLTSSEAVPNYSASSYKDNHNVASGSNYYVHKGLLQQYHGYECRVQHLLRQHQVQQGEDGVHLLR